MDGRRGRRAIGAVTTRGPRADLVARCSPCSSPCSCGRRRRPRRSSTCSYRFGPVTIQPGQNSIEFEPNRLKPPVDGYILSFTPNLTRLDGSVPPVDVLHLHHGVWLSNGAPLFAVGEEKTSLHMPPGYGWLYRTTRQLGDEPHDPQPHAEPRRGLHHLRDGLPAAERPGGGELQARPDALGRRDGRDRLPGVRRGQGHGRPRPQADLPDRAAGAGRAALRGSTATSSSRTGRSSPPRATSTPAGCTRTCGSTARGGACTCSARRRTTGSRPGRSRGTWR